VFPPRYRRGDPRRSPHAHPPRRRRPIAELARAQDQLDTAATLLVAAREYAIGAAVAHYNDQDELAALLLMVTRSAYDRASALLAEPEGGATC
jgi:hypothetical protein